MSPSTKQEAWDRANQEGSGVHWYITGSGTIELAITLEDARCGSHQGQCDNDISDLRTLPYIKEQLDELDPKEVAQELGEYGAWDEAELSDHDANLNRLLWLACGDIREGNI